MYLDMGAIKVGRNAVLETRSVCQSALIVDCDASAWVREECRQIECIMSQDLCDIKVVRNAVMETSSVCQTSLIGD